MIKILLVEDNMEISKNIVEYFKGEVEIKPVYNGEDAIEYLNAYTYDVVILDLMLPGIGGIDVLKHMSKYFLNTDRGKQLGFEFTPVKDYIYDLLDYYLSQIK